MRARVHNARACAFDVRVKDDSRICAPCIECLHTHHTPRAIPVVTALPPQCNRSSPLMPKAGPGHSKPIATGAWLKGTAILVLDRRLEPLGWTWMLPRPEDQLNLHHNGSRW